MFRLSYRLVASLSSKRFSSLDEACRSNLCFPGAGPRSSARYLDVGCYRCKVPAALAPCTHCQTVRDAAFPGGCLGLKTCDSGSGPQSPLDLRGLTCMPLLQDDGVPAGVPRPGATQLGDPSWGPPNFRNLKHDDVAVTVTITHSSMAMEVNGYPGQVETINSCLPSNNQASI